MGFWIELSRLIWFICANHQESYLPRLRKWRSSLRRIKTDSPYLKREPRVLWEGRTSPPDLLASHFPMSGWIPLVYCAHSWAASMSHAIFRYFGICKWVVLPLICSSTFIKLYKLNSNIFLKTWIFWYFWLNFFKSCFLGESFDFEMLKLIVLKENTIERNITELKKVVYIWKDHFFKLEIVV